MKEGDIQNMEELKKSFFVDENKIEEEDFNFLIREFMKRGKVSINGKPLVEPEDGYIKKDLLKLQLTLRFLANKLNKNFSKEVSLKELISWNEYSIKRDQIVARLKEIVDESFVFKSEKGYSVKPFIIKSFLEYLNLKYKNE